MKLTKSKVADHLGDGAVVGDEKVVGGEVFVWTGHAWIRKRETSTYRRPWA